MASPKDPNFLGRLHLTGTWQPPTSPRRGHADTLVLNSRALDINNVIITQGKTRLHASVRYDDKNEHVFFKVGASLKKGRIDIYCAFEGTLSKGMHGLYLAHDGPEKAIVSQCEAADARAIFPCLDEPNLKATFSFDVLTDKDMTVVTNGRPLKTEKVKGHADKVLHHFAPTKKMSTYLVALSIGHFDATKTQQINATPAKIFCGKGKLKQTAFAQTVTRSVLPWYESYFKHPHHYDKLDQVAVPGFDAGAMENVGAIFYRQNLLLMQAGQTSFSGQKRIAEVIAHEIAHQWFGNLVTMQWWDDLWLNEAFATFMAFLVCDAIWPNWHIWDDYLEAKESALVADALKSTHPIYQPVASPAQATELFDVITYEKGCAVLRMVHGYIGATTFRDGIRRYIARHKEGNAFGKDLWRALSQAAKTDIKKMMQGWILQPGFPVVSLALKQKNGAWHLQASQRRFFADPKAAQKDRAKNTWQVPLLLAYQSSGKHKTFNVLLNRKTQTFLLPGLGKKKPDWLYANREAKSFVRLNLSQELRAPLLKHAQNSLDTGAKMSLLCDQWALMRAEVQDCTSFCEMALALSDAAEAPVFRIIAQRLHALHHHLVCTDADTRRFAAFVRACVMPIWRRLGLSAVPKAGKEAPQKAVLRAMALDLMADLGQDEKAMKHAMALAQKERRDPKAVDANVAGCAIALTHKFGGLKDLAHAVKEYQRRKNKGLAPELSARYLGAMLSFEAQAPIKQVLRMCLDGTIPQEQLRVVLGSMLGKRPSAPLAWTFLKNHWQTLSPRVGGMGMARLVEATGGLPYAYRKDIQSFFASNPVPEAERAMYKALEAMDLWQAVKKKQGTIFQKWLVRFDAEPKMSATNSRRR